MFVIRRVSTAEDVDVSKTLLTRHDWVVHSANDNIEKLRAVHHRVVDTRTPAIPTTLRRVVVRHRW